MKKQFYFLSPVEVVKVTSQNLEEVAKWCGGEVQETESRRVPGRMDKYVWVPTPKSAKISWAFPGMFVTKRLVVTLKDELRTTYAVFQRDYFNRNYFGSPSEAVDSTWEREAREASEEVKEAVVVKVSLQEAMHDAIKKVKEKVEEIAEETGVTVEVQEIGEEDLSEKLFDMPETKAPSAVTPHLMAARVNGKTQIVETVEAPVLNPDTHDLDVREEDAITG